MDAATATVISATGTAPAAQIHETHTGIVVLVGDRAYKVKKPVCTDFLDFRTPADRERVCADEVRLNRRLAASSYLGVAHLSDPTGGAAEPVVVMRRHPDALRLATMVATGQEVTRHLDEIAAVLADFHRGAVRGRTVDAFATVDALAARWQENLGVLHRFGGGVVSDEVVTDIQRLCTQFISGRSVLFAQRIRERRVVDGHGDLLAADIFCLPEGPALMDCLEFDDQLRYVDGVDDAAFLAMDLEFLGRADLAGRFLDRYCRLTDDTAPAALRHFYIAYRAVVRAKVDCIRVDQGHPDAALDACRHLELARAHLRAGAVRLIIIGGGPGTGKTTLSRALADEIGAQVISTDDTRRELRQAGRISGDAGDLFSGLYTAEHIDTVYADVLRQAHLLLAAGNTVILDGTWRDPRHRAAAHEMAALASAPMLEFLCTTTLTDAKARIAAREGSNSDATPEIAARLTPDDADWSAAHRIDTHRSLRESVAEAQEVCCLAI